MPISTRWIKVAAASMNQTPLDWENNRANIVAAIRDARARNVHFLCCPELCITGYGCEDSFLSISNCQMALKILHEILPETKNIVVALGLPILHRDGLYNTVCVVINGKIAGFVVKQYLAGDGIHYEPRWFKPWPSGLVTDISVLSEHYPNEKYPMGDLVFEINDLRLGFEICEDAWVAGRTGVHLASRGVDILFNPSASHFAFGKSEIRKRFVQEGARAFGVAYVYANLLGNEAGSIIYDGDTIIACGSQLLATGPRFSYKDFLVTEATLDIEDMRIDRASSSNYPKLIAEGLGVIKCTMDFKIQNTGNTGNSGNVTSAINENLEIEKEAVRWEKGEHVKEEEFSRAVSLGLFDYMRKSKLHGFVLNLSGGADSSTCACLVYLMVHLALRELGPEKFKQKLYFFPAIQELYDTQSLTPINIMPHMLFCIYQRTVNSSIATETAAGHLAATLSASFTDLNIEPIVEQYIHLIERVIDRPLNWEKDDIALQNIQSRVRGPSAWLLANIRNALFIAPGNRSEAAVGYATMDGDTCGGLSPIAGVNKSFVLHWLHWLAEGGMTGLGPFHILERVLQLKPTAELRPPIEEQKDESDLMPYAWLDIIEPMFVRDKQSPKNILQAMKKRFPTADEKKLKQAIRRFFTLWARNQWKRERLPPSFYLDDESVDPKTWCRFPILSGGFKSELNDL